MMATSPPDRSKDPARVPHAARPGGASGQCVSCGKPIERFGPKKGSWRHIGIQSWQEGS